MTLAIGDRLPRGGNLLTRCIGRSFLWLLGWRVEGEIPNLPKMVLLGGPHTSNMDGVLGIATLVSLGLKASTMIKDTAFKGMMGPILRFFGAIPINRKSPKGVVEQSVDAFASRDAMLLLIAPEGTRHNAREWKRGYWHIALGAKVPVLAAAADYQRKVVHFGLLFSPGDDYPADFSKLLDYYAAYGVARYPERVSAPLRARLAEIAGTTKPEPK